MSYDNNAWSVTNAITFSGSHAYYWVHQAHSSGVAYRFVINNNSSYPSNASNRFNGLSLRCLYAS